MLPRLSVAPTLAWAEAQTLAAPDRPLAYAWVPAQRAAVLGLSQSADRELNLARLAAAGIPVLRRASGGGAVLLGPGVLCFGAIAPPAALGADAGIHGAFRVLLEPVLDVLAGLGLTARIAGVSDLAATAPGEPAGRLFKVAGCAQLRKRGGILVHGSLLVTARIEEFTEYLNPPSEIPEYRAQRSHRDFCRTVAELLGATPTPEVLATELERQAKRRDWQWLTPPDKIPPEAEALLAEKYARPEWNLHKQRKPRE